MKRKKTKRRKLIEKLDAVVREIVYIRDEGKCQRCDKYISKTIERADGKLVGNPDRHTSHVVPRSKGNRLRWDLLNLKLLDFHHHINWWHKDPVAAGLWFKEAYPARYEYLMEHKYEVVKYTESDLQELLDQLTEKFKQLEAGL